MSRVLRLNPVACAGHGACAELLPELISLDEWGYPVLAAGPVPAALDRRARRTVTACPALALRMSAAAEPVSTADSEKAQRPQSGGSPGGPARLGT